MKKTDIALRFLKHLWFFSRYFIIYPLCLSFLFFLLFWASTLSLEGTLAGLFITGVIAMAVISTYAEIKDKQ